MRFGPKNLKISFTGKTLTHFGGIYLLYRFFRQIRLKTSLCNIVPFLQRNNRYTIAEELLALTYPISLGIGRIEATHLLKQNGVFQYLTGLPTYPNPTTLRRFLLRMAPIALPRLRKLHDKLLLAMIQKPHPPTRSTILVLYGKHLKGIIPWQRFQRSILEPTPPEADFQEAYFHILLFSYNLINWFKRLCLPEEFQNMTLRTLRSQLLLIPGELIRSGNRPTLKLPANFLYKDAFEYAIKKIEKLKI